MTVHCAGCGAALHDAPTDLDWIFERAGRYHSVHAPDAPWFYVLERIARRWEVYRIVFHNKKRATAVNLTDTYSLAQAKLIASHDYDNECFPRMEARWMADK